jgi:hypothetical protein
MTQQVAVADWLEELAVYGTARRFYDAETAHHLSQAINHLYLIKLATESRGPHGRVGTFATPRWKLPMSF